MTDYMKEAERLAQAYADAVLLGDGNDEALAALLAHIQRGAVPVYCTPTEHEGRIVYEHTDDPIPNADGFVLYAAAPTPAEVPMPEPDDECTHSDDHLYPVWREDQVRTYGDAREAAGYARGLSDERERCASVAWAHYMDTCRRKGIGPDVLPDWCCAAALRGEVK